MAVQFEALLSVQRLDTSIDQHRHRLAHLPEAALVARIEAESDALRAHRESTAAVCAEVAGRQSTLESELASTEARWKAVSARMYSGQVSASRDLQAMAADIEHLKERASDLEDRLLEVLEEREPLDASMAADDEALSAAGDRLVAAEAACQEAERSVRAELDQLSAERTEAATAVPEALLGEYHRIAARAGGVGAARLVGARCEGCHLTLPSMELDRIRHAAPDAVVLCDGCGRILVH